MPEYGECSIFRLIRNGSFEIPKRVPRAVCPSLAGSLSQSLENKVRHSHGIFHARGRNFESLYLDNGTFAIRIL